MTKEINIVGAGYAGLLATTAALNRGYTVNLFEERGKIEDQHTAVLRFRSSKLSEFTGVPFIRKPVVIDLISDYTESRLRGALQYSYKVCGEYRTDRSVARLIPGPIIEDRWIAPPEFYSTLARRAEKHLIPERFYFGDKIELPTITTAPLYETNIETGPWPEFGYRCQVNVHFKVKDSDAYFTLYNGYYTSSASRLSVAGDRMIVELSGTAPIGALNDDNYIETALNAASQLLGIYSTEIIRDSAEVHFQSMAKIKQIDDRWRKRAIMNLTDKRRCYSLGRFATWRPGLLMEDLINDLQVIFRLIEGDNGSQYNARKETS